MDARLLETDVIVFDVGNVLLTFEPEKVKSLLPKEHREALFRATFGPDLRWSAFDLGVETNEAIAQSIADKAGVPDGKDMVLYAFYEFYRTMRPLPLYHLIPALKSMGKRLYALTNYGEPAFSSTCAAFPHLGLLDGMVVSSREKVCKPDPAIFALLTERYGFSPRDALFIDDSLPNTQTAAAMGFKTWHYAGENVLPASP